MSVGALVAVMVREALRRCISALSRGLGLSGRAAVARHIGEGDERAANHVIRQVVMRALFMGVSLALVRLPVMKPLLRLISAGEEVLPLRLANGSNGSVMA